jgi:hypothetical protein
MNRHQLLLQGQSNFESVNNLTSIEDSTLESEYSTTLREINNYMYTIYSTNLPNEVQATAFSIEGIISLKVYQSMKPYMLEKGFTWIAENSLTKLHREYNLLPAQDFNLDYDKQRLIQVFNQPMLSLKNWDLIAQDKEIYIYSTISQPIHLLPLNDDSQSLDPSDEVLQYVDEEEFIGDNCLITIIIEDPIPGRTSLYKEILKMLKLVS